MGTFQYVGLGTLLAKQRAAALTAVNQGANHLVSQAQGEAPNRTGALAAGIHTTGARSTGSGAEAEVLTGAESNEYAIPQHEGAGPHVIRPKAEKALFWPGADHPVKQVNHPGNPATKFLENPLLQMSSQFKAYCAGAMRGQF